MRVGLSPQRINSSAAVLAPTPKLSHREGDVSVVSRVRCRSCVVISSARVNQRTSDRPERVRGGRGGRVEGARSKCCAAGKQPAIGERLEGFSQLRFGACTTSCFSVIIAAVRALTAVSRAIFSWRIISTTPSAVFGVAVD